MKQALPYMSMGLLALVAGGLIRGCAGELRGAAKPAGGQRGGLAAPPARIAPASSPPGGPWANLDQYQAIVETEDSFLITYQIFNRWGRDGIDCVDNITGHLRWHQDSLEGRYTLVAVGDDTFVECSGWPRENHLAVRRLTDGRVVGRPWTVGSLLTFVVSGTAVAVVYPEWHGDEEVDRVRIYDCWGRLVRSVPISDPTGLSDFPGGFAVVSGERTTIIDRRGRRVAVLRAPRASLGRPAWYRRSERLALLSVSFPRGAGRPDGLHPGLRQ